MNSKSFVAISSTAIVLVGVVVAFAVAGDTNSFCSAADRDIVECVRNWVNPATAALTVVAIIYASRQVLEAGKQSNAAVRQSMVVLRDDLAERIDDGMTIRTTIGETVLSEMMSDELLGVEAAERHEKDERFRRWIEEFSFYSVFTPLRHAGHYNPQIQKLADDVIRASQQLD